MGKYIPRDLRREVEWRAGSRCEYCLIHRDDTLLGCEPGHTEGEKLALACFVSNRRKGSDLGSLCDSGELIRFFNPRKDIWTDHFRFDGERIEARTDIGAVTARILGFNEPDRLLERRHLLAAGRLPPAENEEP